MNLSTIIDRYCRVWSEPDSKQRATLLASVWSADATYSDPNVHQLGADELLAHIAKIQASRPGAKVVRTTQIDQHHNVARFGFNVIGSDGTILREGLDIVFLSFDGTKIEGIIGFFGLLSVHNDE